MKKNSFIEGSFIATITILITKFLGIIYVIPFYSIIGTTGATLYSYAYNVYAIFLNISSAGIPNAISKITSEYNATNKTQSKLKALKLSTIIVVSISILAFLILFFFSNTISYLIVGNKAGGNSIEEISSVLRAISFSVLIVPFLSITRGFLQGHKIIRESSNSQIIEQIVRIIIILLGSYLSIKVFHKSISYGVAIALLGAFVGGFCSLVYLLTKIKKNKEKLDLNVKIQNENSESNTIIIKKIIDYSMPFIVITVTANLFNLVDMTLIIRNLGNFGYSGMDSEFIASVITTWGDKFNSIINSIASGVIISLIPHLVSSFTLRDYKKVNDIINKALQIVLYISIPLALFISLYSTNIWNIFYDNNILGATVLKISILTSIFCNIYLIFIQTAQSLNKYKTVYLAVILGFLANTVLDIPFMYLCNYLNIFESYGASIATICGYLISVFIVYKNIKSIKQINFSKTLKNFIKIFISSFIMIFILCILKTFIRIEETGKILNLIYVIISGIIGLIIYLFITFKTGIINSVFDKNIINKNKFKFF